MGGDNTKTGLGVTQDVANEIGQRLKVAREYQKKNTNSIAGRIKVREHYLVAIEEGHWDKLPRGLNGRGLVRNYAKELSVPVPELEPTALRQEGQSSDGFGRTESQGNTQNEYSIPQSEVIKTIQRSAPFNGNVSTAGNNAARQPQRAENRQAPSRFREDADIVTPDLEKILGIPQADLRESLETNQRSDKESNTSHSDASETQKHSTRDSEEEVLTTLAAAQIAAAEEAQRASSRHTEHIEEQQPVKHIVEKLAITEVSRPEPVVERKVEQETTIKSPQVGGAEAAAAYMSERAHTHKKESPKNNGSFFGAIAVAAAIVIGFGAYFSMKDSRRRADDMSSDTASTSETQQSANQMDETSTNDPSSQTMAGGDVTAPLPSEGTGASASVESNNVTGDAAATGASSIEPVQASAPPTVATPAAQAQPVEAAKVEATQAPVEAAAEKEQPVSLGGERTATLTVAEGVEMRIAVDGKQIFLGVKEPGTHKVSFKDKAEIFVKDGSKVKLSYDGWDHGALGHAGRRRRLILNAN